MLALKVFTVLISLFTPSQKTYEGIVHWVIDGDTFVSAADTEEIKVRLDGVDCPALRLRSVTRSMDRMHGIL